MKPKNHTTFIYGYSGDWQCLYGKNGNGNIEKCKTQEQAEKHCKKYLLSPKADKVIFKVVPVKLIKE